MPDDVLNAIRQSVQNLPEVNKSNGASSFVGFWLPVTERGEILAAWGTYARKRQARLYDRYIMNNLWQGAANGVINKFANTPSQLQGGRNLAARFDNVLRFSQHRKGEKVLKKLVARDYLRYDDGAYIEIIAPGNPLKAPTGAVTSLALLDSMHCFPTGDPEYPVVYYNTLPGKKPTINVLHHTRVIHWVDMPDGDQDMPDKGLCALSRAMAIVQREVNMGRYINATLDDKPQPGIVLATGMNKQTWETAWNNFRQQQSTDLPPEWGKNVPIFGMDAALPPKLEMFTFSNPPEKFDFKVYVELDVHELALAIGIDIQDIWELTSGNLGSSGQSEIQHAKSRGNTLGDMLSSWELSMNNYVLPESLEYEHKVRDPYEANERAQNAQTWAGFLQSAGDSLTKEEKRQILANQVEAVADAIIDDSGKIIRLDSADPVAEDQQLRIVESSAPNDPDAETGVIPQQLELTKDFAATRQDFTSAFTDLVNAGLADDLSRRRAGTVLRATLNRLGKQARLDGLTQGGVEELSDDDLNAHAVWLAEQSSYVTSFMDEVYSAGLSEAQVTARAEAWSNKSLMLAYNEGIQSADANGLYLFEGDDGVDGCATCKRLDGQKHRMKDWAARELRPGIDTAIFDCGGWECQHRLVKTTGRASGKW